MALPTTGALSFSDIQTEFGGLSPISASEYYTGGSYLTGSVSYANFGTEVSGMSIDNVPSSGAMQLSNFKGAAGSIAAYTESTSPEVTGLSSSESRTFLLSTYIPGLLTGERFIVSISFLSATSWKHTDDDHVTIDTTKGTAQSRTAPQYYSKQWLLSVSYDGDDSITIGGTYCCSSTSFPNGGAYLRVIMKA